MIEEILQIGKCVLDQQHKLFCKLELEDLEHISEMKSVINGIKDYLQLKNYTEVFS